MNKKSFCIGVSIICLIYIFFDPLPVVVDDIVAGIIAAINLFKVFAPQQSES